jgi:uncharacterized protein YndB with AHSA1/START domain
MPMRIEATRRYPVTVERGFTYITNPSNWPNYWPGFVRLQPGSKWGKPGDESRIVVRLMGRDRELVMKLVEYEPHRFVRYTSLQAGLPAAHHERRFVADGSGFGYQLAVEYEPRRRLAGVFDRTLLARSVRRALDRTLIALERELVGLDRGS